MARASNSTTVTATAAASPQILFEAGSPTTSRPTATDGNPPSAFCVGVLSLGTGTGVAVHFDPTFVERDGTLSYITLGEGETIEVSEALTGGRINRILAYSTGIASGDGDATVRFYPTIGAGPAQ